MPISHRLPAQNPPGAERRTASFWWLGFGGALFLPASTLAFFVSGPHGPLAALLWTLPVWLLIAADRWGPAERRMVPPEAAGWFFDAVLYALVVLQILNIGAMGWMVSRLAWDTPPDVLAAAADLVALRILMGSNSCCAAIAPAHELTHRRHRLQRLLGRILLVTVGYDHFHIAHRWGHHAKLGSAEDPSTARADESYPAFVKRAVVAQWRIAWRAEPRAAMTGLAAEVVLGMGLLWGFGPLAAFAWGYQAVVAVRLLEAVNYFQHLGLTQDSGRAGATAWRSDSAVSLFVFLGLNRHADHHRRPGVPYPELRSLGEGPELPFGYFGTAFWVKNRDAGFRRWAAGRWGLGETAPEPATSGAE